MRVECESCKGLVVASFAIDGAAVRVICPTCHASMVVTVEPQKSVPPEARCPKCGAPRNDHAACPTCGLVAARRASYAETRDVTVPQAVLDAFQRALDDWTDPARHDELLRLVAANDCYAWAAGRYRDEARDRTGDPIAARQLDRVRRATEATMRATASQPPARAAEPGRATAIVVGVIGLAIVIGLAAAFMVREQLRNPDAGSGSGSSIAAPGLDPAHPMNPSDQSN